MVELAEARAMNKKMLRKLKRNHGHRRSHEEHHDGDEVLRGAFAPNGNEIVVVLRGKHYHHHHHYHGPDPSGLEAKFHNGDYEGKLHSKESKHHHRRGRHGRLICHRVIEGTIRGLKHHVKKHQHIYQQYCHELGLNFQCHNQPPHYTEAELMMKNLSLAEDKEANKG